MFFQNVSIFWFKNVSSMIYKMLLLTEKAFVTILWYSTHELYCDTNNQKILYLQFIVAWIVAWKRGLHKPKFLHENLSPYDPLCLTPSPKSQKELFFWLWGSNSDRFLFRVLNDGVLSGFNNNSVPFKVLNDRLLFNFLSDGSSLKTSMIGSSLGCSDIGSSSGSSEIGFCHVFSVLFYWFAAFLKNKKANWATNFFN